MDPDGNNVRQLTRELGYDGGPFFSWDGSLIVYRAFHPSTRADSIEYVSLLKQNTVRPLRMELFVMNSDGTRKRQITHNGAANFCPFFLPDNKRVIFSSNMDDPSGREFDLYIIAVDGSGLERITYTGGFDGFPMFTRDGKHLVFASNRNGRKPHETNIFIADWIDQL
jgi:Tol biopolymer transport system component